MVVPMCEKACGEEVVGELSSLFEPVHALTKYEVHPAVVFVLHEVVFVNDFLRDDAEADAGVLWSIKWRVEVEICQIH